MNPLQDLKTGSSLIATHQVSTGFVTEGMVYINLLAPTQKLSETGSCFRDGISVKRVHVAPVQMLEQITNFLTCLGQGPNTEKITEVYKTFLQQCRTNREDQFYIQLKYNLIRASDSLHVSTMENLQEILRDKTTNEEDGEKTGSMMFI